MFFPKTEAGVQHSFWLAKNALTKETCCLENIRKQTLGIYFKKSNVYTEALIPTFEEHFKEDKAHDDKRP